MKSNSVFEESYFEGYYKGIGDFTDKRDKELINWFKSIFNHINLYFPIKKGKKKKLIEFGCATGAASSVLREYGYEVTATDISKYAVTRARKNYKGVNFLVHSMEEPFTKKKFDVAVAFDVIEHLPDPKKGLKNAYNLLNKNGVAIFTTPNDYLHVYNDSTHISVKKPDEWKKLIRSVGFNDIFVKQVAIMPYFYRLHWRLSFIIPFAVNFKYVISPVVIIARK